MEKKEIIKYSTYEELNALLKEVIVELEENGIVEKYQAGIIADGVLGIYTGCEVCRGIQINFDGGDEPDIDEDGDLHGFIRGFTCEDVYEPQVELWFAPDETVEDFVNYIVVEIKKELSKIFKMQECYNITDEVGMNIEESLKDELLNWKNDSEVIDIETEIGEGETYKKEDGEVIYEVTFETTVRYKVK